MDYKVSGRIYQTTSLLNSTSYLFTVTLLKTINGPSGSIIDSQGYMYTALLNNDYVIKFLITSPTSYQYIAGNGTSGSGLSQLNSPIALAFDSTESNIYVSDSQNHRVLMFSANSTSGTSGQLVALSKQD